ncbi:MAG: TldD/PmbA family protein [Terriglobales bacterium]
MNLRLSLDYAHKLLQQSQIAAPAGTALELLVEESNSELTRFANNAIHQHMGDASLTLSLRAQIEGRTARATSHRHDEAGIAALVARTLDLTRSQAPDADLLPMAGPAAITPVNRWDEATAGLTPAQRAEAVAAMVEVARRESLTAAGICSSQHDATAIVNTNGVEGFYRSTGAQFSVTMLQGLSSGWAKGGSFRWSDLDPAAGAGIAAAKALASVNPKEVPAGRITVILEPAAVLDLLGFVMWDFSARQILEQSSFLSGRLGTKLFGDQVTITDDCYHPLQTGAPFDGEGIPRQRVPLVENGWVRRVVYSRQSAAEWKRQHANEPAPSPTGHGLPLPNPYGEFPLNVVLSGGDVPLERMIEQTERGILVTRLWYIREVDPYQKILTGMTRDGTFLIENGKLAHGVRNFRFNQSMIELFNQIEAMSPSVRASGEESFDMVVPALKVRDFNFNEVTKF